MEKPMKKVQIIAASFLMFAVLSPALEAHEKRDVSGKYNVVVGFVNEPAFNGEMNGVDLRVTKDGVPVEGLEKTLQAEISREGSKKTLVVALRKRYKQPGVYAGYFLPTQPGAYTFHITGTIDGQPFDETFASGSGFHDVEDSKPLRFPQR